MRKVWELFREGLVWLREQRVIRLQAQWRGISARNARRRYYAQRQREHEAALVIQARRRVRQQRGIDVGWDVAFSCAVPSSVCCRHPFAPLSFLFCPLRPPVRDQLQKGWEDHLVWMDSLYLRNKVKLIREVTFIGRTNNNSCACAGAMAACVRRSP